MSISHFRILCVLVILCAACGPVAETPVPTSRAQTVTSTPAALYIPSLALTPSAALLASPFQLDGLEGWCWQDILGLVGALNDVFFLDKQTGWAVGEGGIILHTQDSGVTWQWQTSPVQEDFHRVFFVDAYRGWVAGRGALLHTEDGGRVWAEHPLPSGANSWERVDFAWADAHTGWLIFGEHIFHTFDGGQTWQEQPHSSDWLLEDIVCLDDQHAWVTSGPTILRTTDGGLTWSSHNCGPGYYFSAFTFANEYLGWAVSFDRILHTVDGGQTWYVQHEVENVYGLADVFFLNENTGWAVGTSGQLWFTDDGGMTWEGREILPLWRAIYFVDAQEGWAVGDWQDGERATIMHTRDRGMTWQIQDTSIEMPASAYTASSRLTDYIAQETPLTEALLVRLVPGPCNYNEGYLITEALYSLGWNGEVWENSSPSSSDYVMDTIERFDADVDQDGVDEIVLFSKPGVITTGKFSGLLVGVLDWDGTYWQVAWFDRTHTDYVGGIQVHIEDFDSDGHLELMIQKLHRGTGSGVVMWLWDIAMLRCSHLHCQPVWEETLGEMARSGGGGRLDYTWSGAEYQFGKDGAGRSTIVVQRRGVDADQFWGARYPSGVLETVQVLTTTQSIYLWNNTHYSLTEEFPLNAGYSLDMHPMTETLDLGGDDNLESVVYNWVLSGNGLEQTLSIYTDTRIGSPTQVFTASFTGMPSGGVSLEDVDGDGELELLQCETSFSLLQMDIFEWGGWPSMQPYCTVYDWDSTAPFGLYRPREEAP